MINSKIERKQAITVFDDIDSQDSIIERSNRDRYKSDWSLFVREVLGASPYDYQLEILELVRTKKRLAVKALRGVGKTTLAAWIILAVTTLYGDEYDTTNDVKCIATAGNNRQLSEYLFPEVRKWALVADWSKIGIQMRVDRELLRTKIYLGNRTAFAASPDKPEGIEGAHARTLLLVVDEAKIAPMEVWDAMEGAFSSSTDESGSEAFVFAISTPGAPTGRFYDIMNNKPGYEDWTTYNITYEQAIAADRIDIEWAEQRKRQWGEDDPRYKNQVLGHFADSGEYSLYRLSWLERCIENWYKLKDEPKTDIITYGLDPADTGQDHTALAKWIGTYCERVDTYDMEVSQALPFMQRVIGAATTTPIGIDSNGLGAMLYQMLRDKKYKVVSLVAGAKAEDKAGNPVMDAFRRNTFVNLRSAMYWQLRDCLDPNSPLYEPDLALPDDPDLIEELLAHEWEERNGRIYVLPKDKVKEQISRSPDKSDALVYGWYVRGRARRRASIQRL